MQPPAIPADWPNRAASRQIRSALHLWLVQVLGQEPDLLLIHGSGGATHSWRHLISSLTSQFRAISVELPGRGFTILGARDRCGLEAMNRDQSPLILAQGWDPVAVVGHSAGAAIALRLAQLHPLRAVVGLNAALGEFDGLAGWLFPAMAQLFRGIFATRAKNRKADHLNRIDPGPGRVGAISEASARGQTCRCHLGDAGAVAGYVYALSVYHCVKRSRGAARNLATDGGPG